ncbi:type III restriction-modification system endonuclease [Psychrobacter sanguinis]|uniref:type III restriction-modification system endonuclease n=1 Tax=Psychrobacter sanguinis TaxID=861445 RepID=UPI00020C7ABC|nr:DEAD/DEAH box helicase family protein [Psychrobacter sanguinis]EGK11730.1 type III restriction protein res subunit [Psychrobacter sp. 1501(2011)]MCD9151717.1 DEAD/DEAH box helicase family protein [Psychrobacter sanguinis]
MKIEFKALDYQLNAVKAVADCFKGQPKEVAQRYTIDQGAKRDKVAKQPVQASLFPEEDLSTSQQLDLIEELEIGYANAEISDLDHVLSNIQQVQRNQGLPPSTELVTDDNSAKSKAGINLTTSPVNLNIEMETGTGKTYCYIRSMMELNKLYGWSKFIVVVPSIAIREGVAKTFEMTANHFLETYGKKPRSFVYNSEQLHELETFSSDSNVNVMIINIQAFNSRSQSNRRIYEPLDDFGSRRPIDVIRRNRPIVIIDEPQKLGSDNALKSLSEFDPLFILRYSATHKRDYNLVYRLDALDAYNQKLVKKISVKGIEVQGLSGTHGYLYLQDIQISPSDPVARIELEIKNNAGVKRKIRRIKKGDNLYIISGNGQQYKDRYVVSEIDARDQSLTFVNGIKISVGQALGQVDEKIMRTIQIRETIRAHLQKERVLHQKGLKVLSLFFIDEVSKYRKYDSEGNKLDGEYAQIFVEQYKQVVNEMIDLNLENDPYIDYLKSINVDMTHNGYFSVDKNQHMVNPKTKKFDDEELGRKVDLADDIDAYDLILRDKEALLTFPSDSDSEEDKNKKNIRFIFSHSALREGWDNPNVFVICTLKHSNNEISRRQEIGRGLRLAVNKDGMRMDSKILSPEDIHRINNLTVVTNESYTEFVNSFQNELKQALSNRPTKATSNYFYNKIITLNDGTTRSVNETEAKLIVRYLTKYDYTDVNDHLTQNYYDALAENSLEPLPEELDPIADQVTKLISGIFDPKSLEGMTENENKTTHNPINKDNLHKTEFIELWNKINQKAVFEIRIDSQKLINQSIQAIEGAARKRNNNFVETLRYKLAMSTQKDAISYDALVNKKLFADPKTSSESTNISVRSEVKYDLVGSLSEQTDLTRKSIVAILQGINNAIFAQFKNNPEAFIREVARLINEARVRMVVQGLTYHTIDTTYPLNEVFVSNHRIPSDSLKSEKHVFDYVVTDSATETKFAKQLEGADEVIVYAKLPDKFKIPTPVGDYNPDWAIAFNKNKVRHLYFIAETKGSMLETSLRESEKQKIDSARKFFESLNSNNTEILAGQQIKYDVIDNFDNLLRLVN